MTLERLRSAGTAMLCIAVALFLAVLPDTRGPAPDSYAAAFSASSPGQYALPSHDRHVEARRTIHGWKPGSGSPDLDDVPALLPQVASLAGIVRAPQLLETARPAPRRPSLWRIAAQPRAPPLA
ncbi:hypothetical protein P1X14_14555 [Sphingomonas sp. AOB5]|uniref:hypothetical protein n=1 Tax=Sphingomonas sp. AOB5 TaxID=3034017 RepID=UPI0023F84C66|nr:hypothetical protein [Sphingomonas sp. AOB5]MDF7776473.1 hypothetical protein [Sphingomonas sp. AOB5]